MSNHIYDRQSHRRKNNVGMTGNKLQDMETVTALVTFGCNIPVFVFAYKDKDIKPIAYPGHGLATDAQVKPWWLNYYDKQDVLGYPLAPTSKAYEKLKTTGALLDKAINVGDIFQSWNPLSHNAYWHDDSFVKPVAKLIKDATRR